MLICLHEGAVISVSKTNIMNFKDIGLLFDAGVGSNFSGPPSSYPYLILEADDNDIGDVIEASLYS